MSWQQLDCAQPGQAPLLQLAERVAGAATSIPVDFLISGLDGLHFVAYGTSRGSVVVCCARQLDHIGSTSQDKCSAQQLETLLVLDLQRPASAAAALTFDAASGAGTAAAGPSALPLDDPVLHVAVGGGPHLLIAAATRDTLVVASLEGLAAHLFQRQASGGGTAAPPQPLWQQLAAAHCGHAEVLAISWTQQLDGVLTSSADGTLTMWHLRPRASPSVPEQQALVPPPGSAAGPAAASLRAAWSVHSTVPQHLICAGVSIYAPSATAAGHIVPAGAASGPVGSPARDSSEGGRYASIWWPQHREQRQRHYAGGMPSVGQEKLRHPGAVIGLQWSPGVLQKDALSLATADAGGGGSGGSAVGSPSVAGRTDPGSPSVAGLGAAADIEDHPALMTLCEDGKVRIWVETLVLTESSPLGQPSSEASSGATPPRGAAQQSRRSPGSGSPAAAPSSPRDVRAAAAAAAALGTAAPAITSYFCMALLIDPTAPAGGASGAQPAPSSSPAGAGVQQPPAVPVALWARHAGPLLLHKQQRRVAAPVLWLFTASVQPKAADGIVRLQLQLHAVRGLAAIVMSAGYGGSLSSTSGASTSTRPAAVLWGQHSWDLPAAAAGSCPAQLLQRLCCWVSDEEGFPLLHAFTSTSSGSGSLLLAGRTFSTVEDGSANHLQVHKQLAVASTWQTATVAHEHAIVAIAAKPAGSHGNGSSSLGIVASCDSSGKLLLWDGLHLKHRAAQPAAAFGSTVALAWLPLIGPAAAPSTAASIAEDAGRQHWLAVGSGSMLQCYLVGSRQPVAVSTAAVPAGCSSIKSLHTLTSGGMGSTSDAAPGSSCLLLAVCSSSTGRGSMLCAWRCTVSSGQTGGEAAALQLQLAGAAAPPTPAAVTAAAVAPGSGQLLVGTADGAVQLLAVMPAAEAGGLQLRVAAAVQDSGPVTAVAGDEGCLHLATISSCGVAVWSVAADGDGDEASGEGSSAAARAARHYARAACVQLPAGAGDPTAVVWLGHTVAPCLAVGTSTGSILLLAAVRDQLSRTSWQWLARVAATNAGVAGIKHLVTTGGSCSTVVAAAGDQLLRLSDAVLLLGMEQEGGGTQPLGRLLLDVAGPLPQYHPTFLAALFLSGKRSLAATVLHRLAAWLTALQQHADAGGAAVDAAASLPPSPQLVGTPPGASSLGGHDSTAGGSELPMPQFAGVPLADMVDPNLIKLVQQLHEHAQRGAAAAPVASPGPPQPSQLPKQPAASLDTGMLDMAAFGFGPPAAEPAQQPQPAQHAAGSSVDTGMLDMSAFGFGPPAAEAAPQPQPAQQASPSCFDSGMLDMAAFRFAPPAAEPAPQPQQPAGSSLDTGMLDMAAFGFGPPAAEPAPQPQPTQPAQQAAGSSLDSGMLDMAAFGFGPPAAEPAPQPQPAQQAAASGLDTGMLDMSAFGFGPPAAEPAQQPQQAAASGLDTGMLDMAAFGFGPPAAAAPPQPQQQPQQQQQLPRQPGSGLRSTQGSTTAPAQAGSHRRLAQLPPAAGQQVLPVAQLLPVPADCYQQLRDLLAPHAAADASDDLTAGFFDQDSSGPSTRAGQSSGGLQQAAKAIPGLSLAETSAVLAIAKAFSTEAAGTASGSSSSSAAQSTAPVDVAAAEFVAAVSLALAAGGSSSSSSQSEQQQQQQQAGPRVTVYNAAGVAYTLAPSAVAAPSGSSGSTEGGSSVGQRWGLLPGLDASAVLWALLSGTEEPMLQQALRRVQVEAATADAAAVAAKCADTAAFLAARIAGSLDAADQAPTWQQLRCLGAGFWLRDRHLLAALAERLAKQQFAARRNADDCALLYCALGKRSVLQGLYRSTQNRKLAEFLSRDFEQEVNRQAAQKNAFVLLGQHRHELAAAFFILGGCPREAVGVAANEMRDPQLALVLCRLLFQGAGSPAELSLLDQLQHVSEESASSDVAAAAAACCWLRADAPAAVEQLLRGERSCLAAAATAEHAAQLLPLLHLLVAAVPPAGMQQAAKWRRLLHCCLWSLAAGLRRCGLHALAVEAAAAAQADGMGTSTQSLVGLSTDGPQQQQQQALLQGQLLAEALLPAVLEQWQRHRKHLDADAAYQLDLLDQQGVAVDAAAVLARLRHMRRALLSSEEQHAAGAWAAPLSCLGHTQSSAASLGGSSFRSRESETARWQQAHQRQAAIVAEGQVLFRVDNDKLEAVACCPLMSPDVLGRPVVVGSHRMGLVEGQLHVVPPEPLSPLQEVPDSPTAAAAALLEEEQQQRGGMFSRLLSQLFDQSTWQQDPTWHHGTAEFDVVGSATEPVSVASPHGTVRAHSIQTAAIAAHPSKQLYLTGCSSGLLHLWQFGEQHALATYTPVPGSELEKINQTFSGLLSFSRSFKYSTAAPRLANWGKAAAVRFAPSGERFAAVGEGGVVATWRLDAPTRLADADGHGCAEWWHQALSKQGCAVDFVGGSSSVLVVGGRCMHSSGGSSGSTSNLSVWDTMAPPASNCVGRLSSHQATVTSVAMLPGGWLLSAGDAEGGLSCTDLRMIGGSSGPRLLWSVKAARGALRALVPIPGAGSSGGALRYGSGGSSAVLATAGMDGAVRLWRGSDGKLLQSLEMAHYSSRPGSAGSRRSSHDGAPLSPRLAPGSHAVPVTGLAVCEEGLVSCGSDGCVRLYNFL